jgi:RNA polymerase sigma-70 factor (ECF subfamily)
MSAHPVRLKNDDEPGGFDIESAFVRRAQTGDCRAFEELYRLHVGRVHAVCLRMVVDRDRAGELTQDVFVKVWETLPSFRGESRFSTWLHRVAVNTVLMAMRSDRRRQAHTTLGEDPDGDDWVGTRVPVDRMDLEKAIAVLPPQARIVFILHDVEGYKHEEIAERMEVTVGTTKSQLHRARRILQEILR